MPSKGGQKEAPAPSAPSTPSAPAAAWESESVKTLRAAVEQQSTLLESMADRIAALSASRAEQQPPSPGHAVPPQADGSAAPTPSAAARAAVQEGGDQGAGGDALAGGNTPAAAPIIERDAPAISPVDEAEGEEDEAAAMDALLDELDQLDEPTGDESGSLAGAFQGHPTPLPHVTGNPFPRGIQFQDATAHYHPALVGDMLHGKLAERFEELGKQPNFKGFELYAYELRSLVPLLSYMYDLNAKLKAHAALLVGAMPELPEALVDAPRDVVEAAVATAAAR